MFDTKALILAVKSRPCLWMLTHSGYLNKEERERAWKDVAREIYPNWDQMADKQSKYVEVRKKWANIRDCYRKELHHSRRRRISEGVKHKREYVFSEILTFLRPVFRSMRPSGGESSAGQSPVGAEESTEDDTSSTVEECSLPQSPRTGAGADRAPGAAAPGARAKRRRFTPPPHTVADPPSPPRLQRVSLPTPSPPPPQQLPPDNVTGREEQDPDLYFLYSFLPDMKGMTELQKMNFKIGMVKLLKAVKFPEASGSQEQQQQRVKEDNDLLQPNVVYCWDRREAATVSPESWGTG